MDAYPKPGSDVEVNNSAHTKRPRLRRLKGQGSEAGLEFTPWLGVGRRVLYVSRVRHAWFELPTGGERRSTLTLSQIFSEVRQRESRKRSGSEATHQMWLRALHSKSPPSAMASSAGGDSFRSDHR